MPSWRWHQLQSPNLSAPLLRNSNTSIPVHVQGSVWEIVQRTYEQGGLLAFFSGNEAG